MTSSSSSPTQLTFDRSSDFMAELGNGVDDIDSLLSSSNTNFPLPNPPHTVPAVTPSEQYNDEILRMIAQPKPFYRGRYVTEVNKTKGRPNRFIRADQKDKKHMYPTIKVFIFMRYNKAEMTVVQQISKKHNECICYVEFTENICIIVLNEMGQLMFPEISQETIFSSHSESCSL
jgi:hypothetical protein